MQDRVREVYEKELAYFADMSLNGGSIQGRMNVTQNVVENYVASEEAGVTEIGRSYQYTIEKGAESASDPVYGNQIREEMRREKVIADYAAGKVDYNFHYLRKRSDGVCSGAVRTSDLI